MRTWDDDRHVLTAYATEDPDYPIEFEVEHPRSCTVYRGCTGGGLECGQTGYHVHIYHDCPLAYEIEALGYDEALFAVPMRTTQFQQGLMDVPPEYGGDLWVEIKRQLESGEARVPFGIHYWSGIDYWGEWDYGFEFEVKDAV